MKTAASRWGSLILVLYVPWVTCAAEGQGYDAYKLVKTRHIFDPNRRPPARVEPPRPREPQRPRSSSFTLTGTIIREGRALAFFSGSRSEFSKVIGVGEAVANFKITEIRPNEVELEHEGKKMTLTIGKPFTIEGKPGDPVEPEPAEETAPASAPPADAQSKPAEAATPPPAGGDAKSEILRRMMEKRAKEMGK